MYGAKKKDENVGQSRTYSLIDIDNLSETDIELLKKKLGLNEMQPVMAYDNEIDALFGECLPEFHVEVENEGPFSNDVTTAEDDTRGAVGYSQAPWLSTQHRMQELQHQQGATYATHPQHQHIHDMSHLESERSSEGNISEFESPQMGGAPRHPHYHAHHQYYDSSQPSIDDASHGRVLQVVHLPLPSTGVSSDISHPGF